MPLDARGMPQSSWEIPISQVRGRLASPTIILDAIAREVIEGPGGALAANYDRSGLKQRSGLLFHGITSRGWAGHYVKIQGTRLTVGLDLRTISYARPVLEGHGVIRPVHKKVLSWIDADTGRRVFAKKVRAMPPRAVYVLYPDQIAKARAVAKRMIEEDR